MIHGFIRTGNISALKKYDDELAVTKMMPSFWLSVFKMANMQTLSYIAEQFPDEFKSYIPDVSVFQNHDTSVIQCAIDKGLPRNTLSCLEYALVTNNIDAIKAFDIRIGEIPYGGLSTAWDSPQWIFSNSLRPDRIHECFCRCAWDSLQWIFSNGVQWDDTYLLHALVKMGDSYQSSMVSLTGDFVRDVLQWMGKCSIAVSDNVLFTLAARCWDLDALKCLERNGLILSPPVAEILLRRFKWNLGSQLSIVHYLFISPHKLPITTTALVELFEMEAISLAILKTIIERHGMVDRDCEFLTDERMCNILRKRNGLARLALFTEYWPCPRKSPLTDWSYASNGTGEIM